MANGTVKWFNEKKDLASLNKMRVPMYSFITQTSMQLVLRHLKKATRLPLI